MGSCQNKSATIKKNTFIKKIKDPCTSNPKIISKNIDQKFDDMPEWPAECYKGEGIKRMRGYQCNLNIDQLVELREEFWSIRMKQKLIWQTIKQACIMDDKNLVRAEKIIQTYRIKTLTGCINNLQDEFGNEYHIPNFCINDPYFFKELNNKSDHKPQKINIKLFDLYSVKTYEMKIKDNKLVFRLKEKFYEKFNINTNNKNFRFFFGGVELKDDIEIFRYNIKNDFTIQISVRELE